MASAAENSGKKIILRSSNGEVFEGEEVVAVESQTIKHMIEDDCADNVIPLPKVTGNIFSKLIEYAKSTSTPPPRPLPPRLRTRLPLSKRENQWAFE